MKYRTIILLVIGLLCVNACTTRSNPPATSPSILLTSSPTRLPASKQISPVSPATISAATPTPVLASASPLPQATGIALHPAEEQVTITASDGLPIRGTFRPGDGPAPRPGVLLLHMIYGSREQWHDFAPQLSQAGYASLAIDMRGHGKTGGKMDWEQARDDLQRAWQYLAARPEVDPRRTAIVGASIGANMALVSGAAEAKINALVLLSPGLNYYGVQTEEAIATYGKRPVLIVASRDDSYSAASSQKLSDLAQGAVQLQLYEHAGHGTEMLARQPELGALILNWLNQQTASAGSS